MLARIFMLLPYVLKGLIHSLHCRLTVVCKVYRVISKHIEPLTKLTSFDLKNILCIKSSSMYERS